MSYAADVRRAAVLTIHHRRRQTDGQQAILDETQETGRWAELIFAIAAFHRQAFIELRTDAGRDLAYRFLAEIAYQTHNDPGEYGPDIRRAADMIQSFGPNNIAGINKAVRESGDGGRVGELVLALLNLYQKLMPELSADAGMKWLQDQAMNGAANEVTE